MRGGKRKAQADKLLICRVSEARNEIVQQLLNHALTLAPAADLMGEEAPPYVKVAAEIASMDEAADYEKPALRFLIEVLLHQSKEPA